MTISGVPNLVWILSAYLAVVLVTLLVMLSLFGLAIRRRKQSGAAGFAFLTLLMGGYAFTILTELASSTLQEQISWYVVRHRISIIIPLAILLFILQFSDFDQKVRVWQWVTLIGLPLVNLIFTFPPGNAFYWSGMDVVPFGPVMMISMREGPWFWMFTILNGSYSLIGLVLLILGTRQRKILPRQAWCVTIGLMIPGLINLLFGFHVIPVQLLPQTPLAFLGSGLVFAFALYRLGMLNLVPVAWGALAENMSDGLVVLDTEGRAIDLNPAAREILALGDQDVFRQPVKRLAPELAQVKMTEEYVSQQEISLQHNGTGRVYEIRLSPLQDTHSGLAGQMIILRDITEVKRVQDALRASEERYRLLSITDPLTGCYNRRYFMDLAWREIRRARRYSHGLSLILLDVDHFKNINDTYGHQMGDRALCKVAEMCQENLRLSDVVCRYGGEEFLILMVETRLDEATEAAERLRQRVYNLDLGDPDAPFKVSVSVGVAGLPLDHKVGLDDLIEQADRAMYRAKQLGRNRVAVVEENGAV